MTTQSDAAPPASAGRAQPLASYVLRVRGRPAALVYELVNVSTGAQLRFRSPARLADFLRRHGLAPEPVAGDGFDGRPTG